MDFAYINKDDRKGLIPGVDFGKKLLTTSIDTVDSRSYGVIKNTSEKEIYDSAVSLTIEEYGVADTNLNSSNLVKLISNREIIENAQTAAIYVLEYSLFNRASQQSNLMNYNRGVDTFREILDETDVLDPTTVYNITSFDYYLHQYLLKLSTSDAHVGPYLIKKYPNSILAKYPNTFEFVVNKNSLIDICYSNGCYRYVLNNGLEDIIHNSTKQQLLDEYTGIEVYFI